MSIVSLLSTILARLPLVTAALALGFTAWWILAMGAPFHEGEAISKLASNVRIAGFSVVSRVNNKLQALSVSWSTAQTQTRGKNTRVHTALLYCCRHKSQWRQLKPDCRYRRRMAAPGLFVVDKKTVCNRELDVGCENLCFQKVQQWEPRNRVRFQ